MRAAADGEDVVAVPSVPDGRLIQVWLTATARVALRSAPTKLKKAASRTATSRENRDQGESSALVQRTARPPEGRVAGTGSNIWGA